MKNIQDLPFIDKNIRYAIEQYLALIRQRYADQIEEVILYGSVARSENKEHSDVDLLIIGKTDDTDVEFDILGLSFDILLETGIDISPKCRSRKQFDDFKLFSFHQNVIQDGVRVA